MKKNEIIELLKENNNVLSVEELLKVININENKQFSSISYDAGNKKYEMWDRNGIYISFNSMSLEEYNNLKVKKLKKY